MYSSLILILTAFSLSLVVETSAAVELECNFVVSANYYICQLYSLEVSDVESQEIVISGRHLGGRSDVNVTKVMLFDSDIPFIVSELFKTFVKLQNCFVHVSGLRRIQRDAFFDGGNLQHLSITSNQHLKEIPANVFRRASKLTNLILGGNQIESISLVAFNGLSSLRFLFLGQNQISFLPLNTFRPLISLQNLVISHNFLQSIDSRLFVTNTLLINLNMSANRITGIEENLLDQLIKLRSFDARGNKCVNQRWSIESEADEVSEDLKLCFENFVGPLEMRALNMEVRGKMIIRDEEENEIVVF
jgi:hypothetical protein